jgi:hypothetical protein
VPSLVSAGDDLNAVGEFLAAHARG